MSEVRSVELVVINGGLLMFTKINGVPVAEHYADSDDLVSGLRYCSIGFNICEHLQLNQTEDEIPF